MCVVVAEQRKEMGEDDRRARGVTRCGELAWSAWQDTWCTRGPRGAPGRGVCVQCMWTRCTGERGRRGTGVGPHRDCAVALVDSCVWTERGRGHADTVPGGE